MNDNNSYNDSNEDRGEKFRNYLSISLIFGALLLISKLKIKRKTETEINDIVPVADKNISQLEDIQSQLIQLNKTTNELSGLLDSVNKGLKRDKLNQAGLAFIAIGLGIIGISYQMAISPQVMPNMAIAGLIALFIGWAMQLSGAFRPRNTKNTRK